MTAADIACIIRKAVAADEPAICALMRSERLNPNDLHFANFAVAVRGDELIGATQIKHHRDGSLELGSVVVARPWRGRGRSGDLIDFVLSKEPRTVHAITRRRHAGHYARWGFERMLARSIVLWRGCERPGWLDESDVRNWPFCDIASYVNEGGIPSGIGHWRTKCKPGSSISL